MSMIILNITYPIINGNITSLRVLFSRTILRTCLVIGISSSSSMDRFLKKGKQKSSHEFTELGSVVCVLGRSGIGKTWAVHAALDPCIEITSDVLKSKQETVNFLDKIRGTDSAVILDEYEHLHELVGIREITAPPTNGIFVIISQIPVKLAFDVVTYEFPVPSEEDIRRIVPGANEDIIKKSKGDLRYVIRSLTFKGDAPDEFRGAKEYINDLVSTQTTLRPMDFLNHPAQEPGNISAILHENYIDSKKCDHVKVIENMSASIIFENAVYEGKWEFFPYYIFTGCIIPAVEINHTLKPPFRPGSVWTKTQSAAARKNKIHAMSTRTPGKRLCIDELILLREYAERGNVDILKEYGFTTQDLDVLNHLSPIKKIKAKDLQNLKKKLLA